MKWSAALLAILLTLSAVPMADAQSEDQSDGPLLEDESGDVETVALTQPVPNAVGWDAVDLVSLDLTEQEDFLELVVGVAGFADCQQGTCPNAGDTRSHFYYGSKHYVVQAGISLDEREYAILHEAVNGDYNLQRLATLTNEVDADAFTYTVQIPRDQIVDETGSPPRKDTQIHTIWAHSFSSFSFVLPADPTNPSSGDTMNGLTTSDSIGEDAPASIPITTGGSASSGPVTLSSPAPFRASNGGEGTFRFDLEAFQLSEEERLYDLEFEGVPESWTVERPEGLLRLPPGIPATFSILVSTPFGHQHGGTETFSFRIVDRDDPDHWAALDMGIHYVQVPQPSGHHPTMWFHTTSNPPPFDTWSQAQGGANGQVFMNTIEDDEGDQNAPVQGWTGTAAFSTFHWAVCMQPELLMGIDMDLERIGSLSFPVQSGRGYDGVVISGEVIHLGPGDDINACFSSQYRDRSQTVIATIDPSEPTDTGSSTQVITTTVTPLSEGDYIPFEDGSLLVLELEAKPSPSTPIGDDPAGPDALSLMPGGEITLPLNEYHDARPAGLVGLSPEIEEPVDGNATLDGTEDFIPAAETQDTPFMSAAALVVTLAAVVATRRRH